MSAERLDELDVERSGGFGGLTLHARVPVTDLAPRERAAIEECFRHPLAPPSGPDRFVYRFRMHGHEAAVQEDLLPPALQPLLDRLASAWT
ncbi:MAG TPA: protealysin inhibitor emfourin [Candidatus Dormibacteraeota bacterium]|nr:protealysin inhibitor emfourin [Candidatus Dormibacteraeota bacterium]